MTSDLLPAVTSDLLPAVTSDLLPAGLYVCSRCLHPLFSSRSKFPHSSPWPAFRDTLREDSVTKMMETLTAFKVLCGKCGSGLGHQFLNDGPENGTSRHSIHFIPNKGTGTQFSLRP
ncbi:hypothetical protein CCH79_00019436, partial [Gambusia affinis]